jgi:hypothetical protein
MQKYCRAQTIMVKNETELIYSHYLVKNKKVKAVSPYNNLSATNCNIAHMYSRYGTISFN